MGAALAWQGESATERFAVTRAAFAALLRLVGGEETQRMGHSDLERLLAAEGQALLRQLYQDCVDEQAQGPVAAAEVVDAEGRARPQQRQQRRE